MNHRLLSSILAISCVSASFGVSAETLFRPRVSVGFTGYELAFTGSGSSLSNVGYLKGGFGATIASGRLYYDLGYSGSLGATYDDSLVAGTGQDFLRSDLTLTIGYVLENNITIFGGYKSGKTEYSNLFSVDTTTKFEATGPYFGAGIGFPSDMGTLSFNVAVAFLSATLTDDDPTFVQFDATADSVGYSLGMGYSIPFGDTSGLALKANFQSYNYTGWSDPFYVIDDTQENIFSLDADFYFNF
jgi:hypothetical protein